MGSQSRKSDRDKARHSGGGKGGGGGGGTSGGSEGEETPSRNESNRIYQNAFKKLDEALLSKNFSQAAGIVTSITVSRAPTSDLVNLILAGAKAFSEGKQKAWKPEARSLAETGIRFAQEKTGHELTVETRELFGNVIAENLKMAASKGRSQP